MSKKKEKKKKKERGKGKTKKYNDRKREKREKEGKILRYTKILSRNYTCVVSVQSLTEGAVYLETSYLDDEVRVARGPGREIYLLSRRT